MRPIMFTLFAGLLMMGASCTMPVQAAGGVTDVRRETRFLTDKMAYELHLNNAQYDDVYEINYDFLYSVRLLRDDRIGGFLEVRNEDLRWVLSNSQYRRFVQTDYFYDPIYLDRGRQQFRIYVTYTNRNLFYFNRPQHYHTYHGEHRREHRERGNVYYQEKYRHTDHRRDGHDGNRDNNRNNKNYDSRSEPRSDSHRDARNDARNDSRTGSRRESNASRNSRPEGRSEVKPEVKSEVRPEVKKPEVKGETDRRRSDSGSSTSGGRRSRSEQSGSTSSDRR